MKLKLSHSNCSIVVLTVKQKGLYYDIKESKKGGYCDKKMTAMLLNLWHFQLRKAGDFSVTGAQRNYASGVRAADNLKICSRHWKAMLISPENIIEGAIWERKALFPLLFPTI